MPSSIESHRKWLMLKNFEDLNDCWKPIRDQVVSGSLGPGVTGAMCSTLMYDPMRHGTGPRTTGRISVFTNESEAIQVGFKLIQLDVVKHDIIFKTMESTSAGRYAHIPRSTTTKPTSMTIFWNDGVPYRDDKPDRPPHKMPIRADRNNYDPATDKWKIHTVTGNAEYAGDVIYGKWILVSNYIEESDVNITKLWHTLRKKVKSGDLPAVKMECPSQADCYFGDKPEIHVFTSEVNRDGVNYQLRSIVKHKAKIEWISLRSYRLK